MIGSDSLPRPRDRRNGGLLRGALVQLRVIGALLMRELHTRYGRENIGYLWLIGEPLMLGMVIAIMHSGRKAHEGQIDPVAFAVVGYTIFIMFRGIVNRSEGALEANLPLLYHRMVTVFDIVVARALLEAAGTFLSFFILLSLAISLGYASFPVRPLYVFIAVGYIFWLSLALSMIITGVTYHNRLLERLVHPFTYFMIPLSGAFYQVAWLPQPYRGLLLWNPLPHMFELLRYGQFEAATLQYVDFTYITGTCLGLLYCGMVAVRLVRDRIHLS